jgi:hypothetical protein
MKADAHQTAKPKSLFKLQKLWMRVATIAREQSVTMNDALDILAARAASISMSDISELRLKIKQSEQSSSGSIHWSNLVSGGGGPGTGRRR